MKLIRPPILHNCVVRSGQVSTRIGVVGELGVYGTILWDIRNGTILSNEQAGWILRTKETNSDEVGITAGFGSEDSVCLVWKPIIFNFANMPVFMLLECTTKQFSLVSLLETCTIPLLPLVANRFPMVLGLKLMATTDDEQIIIEYGQSYYSCHL